MLSDIMRYVSDFTHEHSFSFMGKKIDECRDGLRFVARPAASSTSIYMFALSKFNMTVRRFFRPLPSRSPSPPPS